MSKQAKIEQIKEVIKGIHRPTPYMNIFVQAAQTDERTYYSKVPWSINVDVMCVHEAGAKMLEEFFSSDIERLPLGGRQQLHDLLEMDGI